ncbi:MAG: c-type cytochrome biogenesis protein CcsB [Pseudomonadota bacterium]
MNELLFGATLLIYILSTATYAVYFFSQRKDVRATARAILVGGGILHTFYFVACYLDGGHTPLLNQHEAVSFFSWSLTWGYLSFHWRYNVRNFGSFVSPLITGLMVVAAFASRQDMPLTAALMKSPWLPIHASIAIMANAFFALAFCGGLMYLLQERELKEKRFGMFYSRLPSLDSLDNLNHHCLAVGFPLLTLGIITGAIWAKQAFGTFWQWHPKQTWTLITWFIYAGLLHQRFTVGWRGRRAAIMAIVGFLAVAFTLWGVTYFYGWVHTNVSSSG